MDRYCTETETQFSQTGEQERAGRLQVQQSSGKNFEERENWDAQRAARSVPKQDAEASETETETETD